MKMKILLLTSAVLLLTSPAPTADKLGSNPLRPSKYEDSVRTLDEKYAALRGEKEIELAKLRKELTDLESRINSAKEELAETLNRSNSRKIQAGLPAEIDSPPKKVALFMEPGTVRIWPAPRPFSSADVGLLNAKSGDAKPRGGDVSVLSARPSDGDASNTDLVISAHEEGFGNIILTDKKGELIADLRVQVGHPKQVQSPPASAGDACTRFPTLC
jgi:hypothetical protein